MYLERSHLDKYANLGKHAKYSDAIKGLFY